MVAVNRRHDMSEFALLASSILPCSLYVSVYICNRLAKQVLPYSNEPCCTYFNTASFGCWKICVNLVSPTASLYKKLISPIPAAKHKIK